MSKTPKTPFTRNSMHASTVALAAESVSRRFHARRVEMRGSLTASKILRPTNAINGTSYPDRAWTIRTIDTYLEQIYKEQTGKSIVLKLNETPLHPLCDLDVTPTPLPPLPSPPHPSVVDAVASFLVHLLPYAGYFPPARVDGLFQRWLTSPEALTPDQTALILGCIASGYVRLQSRDHTGKPVSVAPEDRLDVLYFRHAVRTLEAWGSASFTSLHALSTLWAYSIMTCPSKTICVLANWLVAQSHDLGIHQEQMSVAYGPSDRADLMLIKVLYAHYWGTSLTGHPPVIRTSDLEKTVVRARPVAGDDETDIALVPRRSLSELLLFNTKLLTTLHDTKIPNLSMEWLNDTEERWENWCSQYIATGRTTGSRRTDPFLDILWDWGRITLRVPTLGDKRLAQGSMSIITRSAVKILSSIHHMYAHELDDINMVWQHLRSVVTCAHIVLMSFWRYELHEHEASSALQQALFVLGHLQVRWGQQVAEAVHSIYEVARALGVHLKPSEAMPVLTPVGPGVPNLSTIAPSLGFMYEPFDALNSMEWTIDSMLFTQEL